MPPEDRIVPRFAAEPPQSLLPAGDWEQHLAQEFLSACLRIRSEGLGEPGDIAFHPERTWSGRTYVPATCTTDTGLELFGLVSFQPAFEEGESPQAFVTTADWTQETLDHNPEWTIDLCDEVVGGWRGEGGEVAAMTAIWGSPVDSHRGTAHIATAELGGLVVDQCILLDGRFTLLAPDDYRGETLEVVIFDSQGSELARESLYAEDEDTA